VVRLDFLRPAREYIGEDLYLVLYTSGLPGEAERPFVEDLPHEVGDHEVGAGELEVDAHGQAGPRALGLRWKRVAGRPPRSFLRPLGRRSSRWDKSRTSLSRVRQEMWR